MNILRKFINIFVSESVDDSDTNKMSFIDPEEDVDTYFYFDESDIDEILDELQ